MNAPFKPTQLSSRLSAVRPSPTITITRLANELRQAGRDVIGLSQGEPDFDMPLHVKESAKAAIDAGATKYTDVDGTPELKRAIAGKFRNENGLSYDVAQISVGTGGKQVLYNALCKPSTLTMKSSSRHPIGSPIRTWSYWRAASQ